MSAPREVLARALGAALLDGPWDVGAMEIRLRTTMGVDRPWMRTLAVSVRRRFATAPADALDALATWLSTRRAFYDAARERLSVVHFATPSPAMAASPWPVPALATTRDLAAWLGLEIDALEILANRRGVSRHYRYAWIPKARGGHRLLEAPMPRLRWAQRRILDGILAHIPPHDAAHGFRAGRSIIGFAEPHVGRDVVVRVDLRAFFSSVFAARVVGMFRTAGYPEEVARTLAASCTHRTPSDILAAALERDPLDLSRLRTPHLPQGAPTSGALANLAAYRLDVRVCALAASLGAHYTRYADDLVVSGDRALVRAAPTLVARLGAIALEEGFALNFRKTRVMTSSSCQQITGLVVNNKLSVPRGELERLRATLHNCARLGPSTQNRDSHPDFRAHLLGRLSWITSIDPAKGARLRAVFDQIYWK